MRLDIVTKTKNNYDWKMLSTEYRTGSYKSCVMFLKESRWFVGCNVYIKLHCKTVQTHVKNWKITPNIASTTAPSLFLNESIQKVIHVQGFFVQIWKPHYKNPLCSMYPTRQYNESVISCIWFALINTCMLQTKRFLTS